MLKNLSNKGQRGFTLVELLVAIAIIAILAVIGLTVFTGLQRGARDAQRRSDVEAIAKSLEANYNTNTAVYPQLLATMFAGGRIPQDPLYTAAGNTNCAGALCDYCIATQQSGGTNPTDPTTNGAGGACGTSGTPAPFAPTAGSFNHVDTSATAIPANTTGFLVCTNLEGSAGNATASHYCQGSQR